MGCQTVTYLGVYFGRTRRKITMAAPGINYKVYQKSQLCIECTFICLSNLRFVEDRELFFLFNLEC